MRVVNARLAGHDGTLDASPIIGEKTNRRLQQHGGSNLAVVIQGDFAAPVPQERATAHRGPSCRVQSDQWRSARRDRQLLERSRVVDTKIRVGSRDGDGLATVGRSARSRHDEEPNALARCEVRADRTSEAEDVRRQVEFHAVEYENVVVVGDGEVVWRDGRGQFDGRCGEQLTTDRVHLVQSGRQLLAPHRGRPRPPYHPPALAVLTRVCRERHAEAEAAVDGLGTGGHSGPPVGQRTIKGFLAHVVQRVWVEAHGQRRLP